MSKTVTPVNGDVIEAFSPSNAPVTIRVDTVTVFTDGTIHVHERGSNDIYEFPCDGSDGWRIVRVLHEDDPLTFPPFADSATRDEWLRCAWAQNLVFPTIESTERVKDE